MAQQNPVDGSRRQTHSFLFQPIVDFARSPVGTIFTHGHHPLFDVPRRSPRAMMGTPTSLLHTRHSLFLVSVPPAVSGRSRNPELRTHLPEVFLSTADGHNKYHALVLHVCRSPSHPRPLCQGLFHSSPLTSLRLECNGCPENAV